MFPKNATQLKKVTANTVTVIKQLFEARNCQIYVTKESQEKKKKKQYTVNNCYVELERGEEAFRPAFYPLIANALVVAKSLTEKSNTATEIEIRCDEDVGLHVRTVCNNFCKKKSISPSSFSVASFSTPRMNIVDFLSQHTEKFSVRLVESSLAHTNQDGRVGTRAGVRLSHLLESLVSIVDWEQSFKSRGCNVMLRNVDPEGHKPLEILEHVHSRDIIRHPFLIETPKYNLSSWRGYSNFLSNSAYETYQFCMKIPDSEVDVALRSLTTYLPLQIETISNKHKESPEKYYGQQKVAENIIMLNKGDGKWINDCAVAAEVLYKTPYTLLDLPSVELERLERVNHVVTIPYKADISFSELCLLYSARLPKPARRNFDWFVEQVIFNGFVICNSRRLEIDHIFSEKDMLQQRSVFVNKKKNNLTAFIVRWEVS